MFCTNCGKEVSNTSNFCTHCGNKIKNIENTNANIQVQTQQNIDESQNQKTIRAVFHRMKRFTGCAVPLDVYVDKKIVGSLNNDGTFEIDIPYGTHSIILEMWSCVNEQQITFSEEYSKVYLDIKIKIGAITNKPEIVSIRNEK